MTYVAESTTSIARKFSPTVPTISIGCTPNTSAKSGLGQFRLATSTTAYLGHAYGYTAAAPAVLTPLNASADQHTLKCGVWTDSRYAMGFDSLAGDSSTTFFGLEARAFWFKNSSASYGFSNACTNAHIGQTVYFENGETVGNTSSADGSHAYAPPAGILLEIDTTEDMCLVDMTQGY